MNVNDEYLFSSKKKVSEKEHDAKKMKMGAL